MKNGRTHLAHKAEHVADMKTGAVLAVTVQEGDAGDTTTVVKTLGQPGENMAELIGTEKPSRKPQAHLKGIEEMVADKGHHSVGNLQSAKVRTYVSEKKKRGIDIGKAKPRNSKRSMRIGGE